MGEIIVKEKGEVEGSVNGKTEYLIHFGRHIHHFFPSSVKGTARLVEMV
jgi:hypothetical protein